MEGFVLGLVWNKVTTTSLGRRAVQERERGLVMTANLWYDVQCLR